MGRPSLQKPRVMDVSSVVAVALRRPGDGLRLEVRVFRQG